MDNYSGFASLCLMCLEKATRKHITKLRSEPVAHYRSKLEIFEKRLAAIHAEIERRERTPHGQY